jgi:hypothetical protein
MEYLPLVKYFFITCAFFLFIVGLIFMGVAYGSSFQRNEDTDLPIGIKHVKGQLLMSIGIIIVGMLLAVLTLA